MEAQRPNTLMNLEPECRSELAHYEPEGQLAAKNLLSPALSSRGGEGDRCASRIDSAIARLQAGEAFLDPEEQIAKIHKRTDLAFKLYLAWWLLICLLVLAAICFRVT
jgi:hypothetical protein